MRIPTLLSAALLFGSNGWAQESPHPFSVGPWQSDALPFSFKYAGKKLSVFLPSWQKLEATGGSDEVARLFFVDPTTHLMITAEVRAFGRFNAVEWVLMFKNTAAIDMPISDGTWGADTTAHKLAQSDLVKDEHLPFDVFWIDARSTLLSDET